MKKTIAISAITAVLVSLITIVMVQNNTPHQPEKVIIEQSGAPAGSNILYARNANGELTPLNFVETSAKVVNAVVHIKSTTIGQQMHNRQYQQLPDPFRHFFYDDFFDRYFNQPPDNNQNLPMQMATGSGVIINADGYIITNNHVIDNADEISVTLHDNRSYKATLIGTDPTTDLALLKVEETDLPHLVFVNSDDVRVGEWVLAVGNPFSLNSTVTAGIVSAKARNINILREEYAVESFIQTDAAINPGNSGGALVNLNGDLVGINTAIASPTGAYSGYGFAVPSNIASKVVEDLLKYGSVQRGVLGVMIRSVNSDLANEMQLDITTGAYVDSLVEKGAAQKAGIKPGDVIIAVDENSVNSSPQLQEYIARHRPGDKVTVKVNRFGKIKQYEVTLSNRVGKETIASENQHELLNTLGVELKKVDKNTARKLKIDNGLEITRLHAGKLARQTQVREGFIITHIDKQQVSSIEEFIQLLSNKKGGILLQGVYRDIPGVYYYAFGL